MQSSENKQNITNVLYGKKWAVCGDSFTDGDFTGSPIKDNSMHGGRYDGRNRTYGFIIGDRNDMDIQHLAVCGMTLATPKNSTFSNVFSTDVYKRIDKDCDYITLNFGINDSHHRREAVAPEIAHERGIIDLGKPDDADTSTFYGAWNVVLEYIIRNHPTAHIGILVTNACETDDYRKATIEMAIKWGIPYIDLNGDERTPMMHRSSNPAHSDIAKQIRLETWAVNPPQNTHPNVAAHEFESTFIETFLRSI